MRTIIKFFGNFFAFLFTIIYTLLVLGFITIIIGKETLNSDNIADYFSKSNVMDIKLSEIYGDSGEIEDPNSALGFYLRDLLTNEGMSKSSVDTLINSDVLKSTASKFIGNQITYNLGIDEYDAINYDELINSLNSSSINMKQKDNEALRNAINSLNNQSKGKIINIEYPTHVKDIIKIAYNDNFILYFVGVTILFYLLLAFFTWTFYKPILCLGISTVISGSLITIIGCVQKFFINSLKKIDLPYIDMILDLLKPIFTKIIIYGVSAIAIGIILLIIHKIIKKRIYHKLNTDILLGNKLDDNIVVGVPIINETTIPNNEIPNEPNNDETTN